ncbi:MAG: hypothetical protein WCP26_11960 [Actinomycetes bacterium]
MTGLFANLIIGASLALAVWAIVLAAADKRISRSLLIGAAALELLLLVFFIGGVVQMISTDHSFAKFEFVAYLVGLLVIPPLGIGWAWDEKSRSGMVVIAVVFLVVPIMVLRVQQVWAGPGV